MAPGDADASASPWCAASSVAAGESQFGTAAPGIDAWLMLEYTGAWAGKAWEAAQVSDAVRAHVDAFVDGTAGARLQLIGRPGAARRGPAGVVVMLASTRSGRAPLVARWQLDGLDALTDIDLTAALAAVRGGAMPADAQPVAQPLLLVCTNGKRDRCCAKFGVAVYEVAARRAELEAWQTTHLGGHRFAATALWLPEGLCVGRLTAAGTDAFLDAALRRELGDLALLRGRTCLSEAAQAAECLWRSELDLHGFDDIVVEGEQPADDGVQVRARVRGAMLERTVRSIDTGAVAAPSCGKPPAPVLRWA